MNDQVKQQDTEIIKTRCSGRRDERDERQGKGRDGKVGGDERRTKIREGKRRRG